MSNVNTLGSFGDTSNSSLMFRNKLINGGFDIWQRGTSQTSSGYGSDDRWFNENLGSTKTASRQAFTLGQTDVPGNPQYFSRTVVTSVAGVANYASKKQSVEGVKTFAGQSATLSFWAKADAAKNIAVEFTQAFGTGGSPSATITSIGVTTFALTTTFQRFTVTISIPSSSGKTLGTTADDCLVANFWFDAGSNYNARTNSLGQQSGTFDIAQVQLEAGTAATPFEQRPVGMELSLCQRYCQVLGPYAPTFYGVQYSTDWNAVMSLPVQMRAAVVQSSVSVRLHVSNGTNRVETVTPSTQLGSLSSLTIGAATASSPVGSYIPIHCVMLNPSSYTISAEL